MNGRFLFGVLSGVVLVAGTFVLGSALFPVEDSRSAEVAAPEEPAAAETEVAEDEAAEAAPLTVEAEGSAAPATEAEAATTEEPVEEPADQPADAPETAVAAAPEPVAEATEPTAEPADAPLAEPLDQATAETAAAGVTDAGEAAGASAETEAETPSADPSPATEPTPQATEAEQPAATLAEGAAEVAPDPASADAPAALPEVAAAEPASETAPEVPSTAEPAALPALPDLARLDADAVLAALDNAAAAPPAPAEAPATAPAVAEVAEDPAPEALQVEAPQVETPQVEEPQVETPQVETAQVEPPASETPTEEAPADEAPAAPEAAADAGDNSMPGTPADALPAPEALPETEVLPEAEPDVAALPEAEDPAAESTFKPSAGLGDRTEGVIVGRLPRIGDAAVDEVPDEGAPMEEGSDDAAPAPDEGTNAADADPRPIVRFAATFENPEAKPTVAVVLIDPGTADLDRAALGALPFPVSFALDPLDPATPERAAIYRAAGREVVMLATGIADGAQASDIEVAFQSMEQGLPEAVAVMDLAEPMFQNRRPLASLVVPVVGAQGRGLLTWDAGLNAADQVARREDIPAAVIFRDLTSGGTDSAAIRRVLDRAIFKAGQDGRAVVAATASPEIVAALLEWSVEGRAATVALAPLTAVLTVE